MSQQWSLILIATTTFSLTASQSPSLTPKPNTTSLSSVDHVVTVIRNNPPNSLHMLAIASELDNTLTALYYWMLQRSIDAAPVTNLAPELSPDSSSSPEITFLQHEPIRLRLKRPRPDSFVSPIEQARFEKRYCDLCQQIFSASWVCARHKRSNQTHKHKLRLLAEDVK